MGRVSLRGWSLQCTRGVVIAGVAIAGLAGCDKRNSPAAAPDGASLSAPAEPPRISLAANAAEAECDLGRVPAEGERHVVFLVENSLDRPVAIQRIRSDCGCLTAVKPPAELAPGVVTPVTLKFVAPNEAIPYLTKIILVTDDPQRRYISLSVRSQIVKR